MGARCCGADRTHSAKTCHICKDPRNQGSIASEPQTAERGVWGLACVYGGRSEPRRSGLRPPGGVCARYVHSCICD